MSMDALLLRLARVTRFRTVARGDDGDTTIEGDAAVDAAATRIAILERGSLVTLAGSRLDTRNAIIWTRDGDAIGVSHDRFGPDRAVALVRLREVGPGECASEAPHLCGDDQYACKVRLHDDAIEIVWSIVGPRKRMTLTTIYS